MNEYCQLVPMVLQTIGLEDERCYIQVADGESRVNMHFYQSHSTSITVTKH